MRAFSASQSWSGDKWSSIGWFGQYGLCGCGFRKKFAEREVKLRNFGRPFVVKMKNPLMSFQQGIIYMVY